MNEIKNKDNIFYIIIKDKKDTEWQIKAIQALKKRGYILIKSSFKGLYTNSFIFQDSFLRKIYVFFTSNIEIANSSNKIFIRENYAKSCFQENEKFITNNIDKFFVIGDGFNFIMKLSYFLSDERIED